MAKEGKIVSEFKYSINPDYDYVIEDGANSSICLRKISWGEREEKLDLRKYIYSNGEEQMRKGISMSDEAGDELACVLAETGYGDTKRILKGLSKRDDYEKALASLDEPDEVKSDDTEEEGYYNPNDLIA